MSTLAIILAASSCARPEVCCSLTSDQFIEAVRIAALCDDEDLAIVAELACAGCAAQPPQPAPARPALPGPAPSRPVPPTPPNNPFPGGDVIPPLPGRVPPIPAPVVVIDPPGERPHTPVDDDLVGSGVRPPPEPPPPAGGAGGGESATPQPVSRPRPGPPPPPPPAPADGTEATPLPPPGDDNESVPAPIAPPWLVDELPKATVVFGFPRTKRTPTRKVAYRGGVRHILVAGAPSEHARPPTAPNPLNGCGQVIDRWAKSNEFTLRWLYRDAASAAIDPRETPDRDHHIGILNAAFARATGVAVGAPDADGSALNMAIAVSSMVIGNFGGLMSYLFRPLPRRFAFGLAAAAGRLIGRIGGQDERIFDAYTIHAGLMYAQLALRALDRWAPGYYENDDLVNGVADSTWLHIACGRTSPDANVVAACPLLGSISALDQMTSNYAVRSGNGSYAVYHPDTVALGGSYEGLITQELLECLRGSGLDVEADQVAGTAASAIMSLSWRALNELRVHAAPYGVQYSNELFVVPWTEQAAVLDPTLAASALRLPWVFARSSVNGWQPLMGRDLLNLR